MHSAERACHVNQNLMLRTLSQGLLGRKYHTFHWLGMGLTAERPVVVIDTDINCTDDFVSDEETIDWPKRKWVSVFKVCFVHVGLQNHLPFTKVQLLEKSLGTGSSFIIISHHNLKLHLCTAHLVVAYSCNTNRILFWVSTIPFHLVFSHWL